METIFSFLLKASAGIVLFYIVYWLFLRKETFYTANRWFLILGLVSAILLPLFPVQYTVLVEASSKTTFKTVTDTFKNIPVFTGDATLKETITWQQVVLVIYITGAAIFMLRLLTQTFILIHLMLKYKIKSLDGVRIVENEKYGLPFSFFNVIFINPKFHTQEDLPEILAHEKVHIREIHWFDLLFIELLTVIFWFNPFIWLFERSIKQNHEYLADKGVLDEGHTVARYQALLINQLMGMQIIGITNNLNFALNTNRLKMMTKKKTSAKRLLRFSLTLPVLAILLYAFADPSYQVKEGVVNDSKSIPGTVTTDKTVKLSGIVLDENSKPLPGTSIVIKGGTVGTVSDIDGKFNLEVPDNSSIVLSFVGKKTIEDTYEGIISGYKKDDSFNRKYVMLDVRIPIFNRSYTKKQMPPPPPPPPPAPKSEKLVNSGSSDIPPPPPPKADGEQEIFYVVEDMPKYPGGYEAMQDFIAKMQQKIAQSKGVKGTATVGFTIDAKGKVNEIKVVEKDNDDAAKGAVMLASAMPDWTPGKQRGKPVPVKYIMSIEFK